MRDDRSVLQYFVQATCVGRFPDLEVRFVVVVGVVTDHDWCERIAGVRLNVLTA